jgi:hypothetical protein
MVAEDLSALLAEIELRLHEPARGGEAALARIELTLTDGYARALELEGLRWRLDRRIAEVAALLEGGPDEELTSELAGLYARLASTDADLRRLRETLVPLRRHAAAVRAA